MFDYVTYYGIISHAKRKQMVNLILDLHNAKQYKGETAYVAVSIADRYLCSLGKAKYPDLVHLAASAILLAAKLE